jgi:hypothetical protein
MTGHHHTGPAQGVRRPSARAADLVPGMLVDLTGDPFLPPRATVAPHLDEVLDVVTVGHTEILVHLVSHPAYRCPPEHRVPVLVEPVSGPRLWEALRAIGFRTRVISRRPGHLIGIAEYHHAGQLWRVTRMPDRRGQEIRMRWGSRSVGLTGMFVFDPSLVTVWQVVRLATAQIAAARDAHHEQVW